MDDAWGFTLDEGGYCLCACSSSAMSIHIHYPSKTYLWRAVSHTEPSASGGHDQVCTTLLGPCLHDGPYASLVVRNNGGVGALVTVLGEDLLDGRARLVCRGILGSGVAYCDVN